MTIVEAAAADVETVRRLFRAYAAALPFSLAYQDFDRELAGLPAPYVPPGGALLARRGGAALGIVGVKPLAPAVAEVKRLYVEPAARGLGLGRRLLDRALAAAAALGYERVRLDSHRPSMAAAIALYRQFGFTEIAPYGPNPDGQFAFFEMRLLLRWQSSRE